MEAAELVIRSGVARLLVETTIQGPEVTNAIKDNLLFVSKTVEARLAIQNGIVANPSLFSNFDLRVSQNLLRIPDIL